MDPTVSVMDNKMNGEIVKANEIIDSTKELSITDGSEQNSVEDFKPSLLRFLVAFLLCLSSAMSGYILQTYVTIYSITQDAYGITTQQVNMFSLVYAIFYIPGSMLSIALYAKYGLSYCLVGGAAFNFLSGWIRYFNVYRICPIMYCI